jgi:hypothetical protein
MQIGDLVMIKQGSRNGKLAIVSGFEYGGSVIRVIRGCGDWYGYYRRDLEVICK